MRIYPIAYPISHLSGRDKQHTALTLGLGGLYPAPLTFRAVLAPETGQTKTILDVGEHHSGVNMTSSHLYKDAGPVSGTSFPVVDTFKSNRDLTGQDLWPKNSLMSRSLVGDDAIPIITL